MRWFVLIFWTFAILIGSVVTEEIHDFDVREVYSSSDEPYPEELHLQVRADGNDVTMRLRRNDGLNHAAPSFTMKNGLLVEDEESYLESVPYKDVQTRAAVLVTSEEMLDGREKRMFSGIFASNDGSQDQFELDYITTETRKRASDEMPPYILVRRRAVRSEEGDPPIAALNDPATDPDVISRSKRGKKSYGVELLMVTDYSMYKKWQAKGGNVKDNMRKFMTMVANGMDLRYENIDVSDMKLYIRVVGFVFITREWESRFTEKYKRWLEANTIRQGVEAEKALNDFWKWRRGYRGQGSKNDHAMLFTEYELYDEQDVGVPNPAVAGLAYLKAACKDHAASIVEGHSFGCITVAAHELGHSLGAEHDGEGRWARCRTSDQYIMAPTAEFTNDNNARNPYHFSHCSVEQFRAYFQTLDAEGKQCLTNTVRHLNPSEYNRYIKTPPGQWLDVDEQCKNLYGPESGFCGFHKEPSLVCHQLWCTVGTDGRCSAREGAVRGTTCGHKKWCHLGSCQYDSQAPPADDDCPFGEPATPQGALGKLTCAEYFRQKPGRCYGEDFRKLCCKTCKKNYNSNRKGCEYGDHAFTLNDRYHCSNIFDYSQTVCDIPDVKEACCKTCA